MKIKNIISLSIIVAGVLSLTGCSTENPFGVGYEHSACESSSKFGVCGAPEDVYTYRDKIRKIQQDYLKAGLDDELFFGITHDGKIMVKEGRTDKWQQYNKSKWEKIIEERVYGQRSSSTYSNAEKTRSKLNYYGVDIPVTQNNDLSIKYQRQGTIIQTRTNVGDMIRDNGLVQRIWVAPVVDKKGDLISAHELYVVVKEPKWIIGERTPKTQKRHISKIPTPISQDMIKKQNKIDYNEESIIQDYNSGNQGSLIHNIENNPRTKIKEIDKNLVQIKNFIEE